MKHTIVTKIVNLHYDEEKKNYLPLVDVYVRAGFPSPATDYMERALNLNEYLIQHPSATYYIRVAGDSMVGYGIFDNDLLIVDRSLEPSQGDIIIVALDGELTCKLLAFKNSIPYLKSGNSDYPPIEMKDKETYIWGVVIHNIHSFRKRRK